MSRPFTSVVFVLSFALAFLCFFAPLRGDVIYWRPMMVFLTVTFWLLAEPHTLGIGFAWIVGFVLDLVSGGVLGEHALALAISAYLLQLAGQRMNNFSVLHQLMVVAGLALFYQLAHIVISLVAGQDADTWRMLYAVVSTVILWPFWAMLLWKFYRPE
jgi:rod shape-determining protein MreD